MFFVLFHLFVGRTILLIIFLRRMRSIYFWLNKGPQQLIVLTHPFPPQPQHMVATNISPLQGSMEGTPQHEGSSLNATIFMCDQMVNMQTREKKYDNSEPTPIYARANIFFQPVALLN
jgi:hypothetical protein